MIRIGNFQVDFEQREIWRGGATLRVGSRALDILQVLIDADGALVSKDEIMQRVWPHSFVEENNLQVQIAWLRKAFGEDRDLIRTVPGRGYQLIAPKGLAASAPGLVPLGTKLRLPANASKLVGRDAMVSEIAARLGEVSELTLVGAGGIGKTSLAIEVAHKIGEQFRDGVYFLELAALSDTNAVLAAVAETCGTPFAYDAVSAKRIAQALADSQCLIVLDNAEHVIEAVAELVCALVARAPGLRVLATSREPLRVANESIFRVQPLAVPAVGAPPDEVFSHAAVQLFLSRARAIDIHFGVDLRSARLIGDICRRLDGIALAIELAAARAATLGVEGVYDLLDDRMQLLTGGHRQSLPRHQTLRATFDWSYALLDPISRTVFRRLGIFASAFTLESVCAVAADQDVPIASLICSISNLAAKSLLNVDFEGAVACYRLTESTRAYALDRLRDEGEFQQIAGRHARFLQHCFQRDRLPLNLLDGDRGRPSELCLTLDDARDAIDRAFTSGGDARLGLEMARAVVEVLLDCSLMEECCTCAARAVDVLETLPHGSVDTRCEMGLRSALAVTPLHTVNGTPELNTVFPASALQI